MGLRVRPLIAGVFNTLLLWDHFSSSKTNMMIDAIPKISNPRVAILAIYYPERYRDLTRYIEELGEMNFVVVPILNVSEANSVYQKMLPFLFYRRRNLGFDLGIFRDALNSLDFSGPSDSIEIILVNDSMIYSQNSLKNLVKISRRNPQNTLSSMLQSFQRKRHLQTFFMHGSFNHEGFESLRLAFSQIRNWKYKRSVVVFGEKKLHQVVDRTILNSNGLWDTNSLKELIDKNCQKCKKLLETSSKDINPTNHLIHLLNRFGIDATKF